MKPRDGGARKTGPVAPASSPPPAAPGHPGASGRGARLNRLALAAAARLRGESPALARVPKLVLARRLAGLVEAALEASAGSSRASAEALAASVAAYDPGLDQADFVLELLETEFLLEELVVAEEGPEFLQGARWDAVRAELRRLVRQVAGHVELATGEQAGCSPWLAALLEEVPEAVMLVDGNERVRYANGRVCDAYGLDPGGIVGRSLADVFTVPELLLRLDDPGLFLDATHRMLADRGELHEDVFHDVDGATFLRRSAPAGEGACLGRLVITTNVTRLRERNRAFSEARGEEEAEEARRREREQETRPRLTLVRGGRRV